MRSRLASGVILAVASATQAAAHRVGMAGAHDHPETLEARVGDGILLINDDSEAHNVFVPTVAFSTDLGKQDPDKTARLLLTKPGVFGVECVFHPGMTARVIVTP